MLQSKKLKIYVCRYSKSKNLNKNNHGIERAKHYFYLVFAEI